MSSMNLKPGDLVLWKWNGEEPLVGVLLREDYIETPKHPDIKIGIVLVGDKVKKFHHENLQKLQ